MLGDGRGADDQQLRASQAPTRGVRLEETGQSCRFPSVGQVSEVRRRDRVAEAEGGAPGAGAAWSSSSQNDFCVGQSVLRPKFWGRRQNPVVLLRLAAVARGVATAGPY